LKSVAVKDLYVNIPINETIKIKKNLISNHNNEQVTKQIATPLETVLKQNYLSFQGNIYQTMKGGREINGEIYKLDIHIWNKDKLSYIDFVTFGTSDDENLSGAGFLGLSRFCMVFFVRNAIWMLVKAYVGQTGRLFSQRYKGHQLAFYKNNPSSSSFA
jgi:hypothetical protein